MSFPTPVLEYIQTLVINSRLPAYLLIAKDGRLLISGGELAVYGISDLHQDEALTKQLFFLEGLLPLDEQDLFLPCLKTEQGRCADIHLFSTEEGDWVLFLDATAIEAQYKLAQQYSNELSLLRTQQAKSSN